MANTAKTAIVTGASQGIGAGLVDAFLQRGYSAVANSRHITKTNPFAFLVKAPDNAEGVDSSVFAKASRTPSARTAHRSRSTS
jgi:NAD(P)-dependent dehydrogenase (short-subunit alcohol dehydrogenase family)